MEDTWVWVMTQGEAPEAWEMSISHGKARDRLPVGPGGSGQGMNLSASAHLCEFSATVGTCQIPEEASAGWSAERPERALRESWANEAHPCSGLAALGTMVAFCPHSFSRGRLGCILSSDPLHGWVLGMEKLRAGGVGEGGFVMRDLLPSTSLPG